MSPYLGIPTQEPVISGRRFRKTRLQTQWGQYFSTDSTVSQNTRSSGSRLNCTLSLGSLGSHLSENLLDFWRSLLWKHNPIWTYVLLIQNLLPLGWSDDFQLEAWLIYEQNCQAKIGIPHLERKRERKHMTAWVLNLARRASKYICM